MLGVEREHEPVFRLHQPVPLAGLIPEAVREAHPEIEWRQIVGVRNQVAHGYLGIDDDTIWSIIQTSIPELLAALRRLLEEER